MTVGMDSHHANGNDHATHTNGYSNGHQESNGYAASKSPLKSDGFSTLAIHVGSEPDPTTGAVIPPISLSTTFAQSSVGVHKGYEYSRSGNPNRDALEKLLASLEAGGGSALTFGSGSAATGAVLAMIGRGGHVLSVNDVYGGTWRYLKRVAGELQGVETTFVDLEEAAEEEIYDAIRDDTKLIWIETPTNPTLRVVDIPVIVSIARRHPSKPLVLVDNTFLSPFYSSPLILGADLVLHSLTKYINGHSDVVMGAVIVPPHHTQLIERLRFLQNAMGAVPSAYDSWLAQRGAKTLGVRMRAHGENALALAKVLQQRQEVEEVIYPGLATHKRNAVAWRGVSAHAKKWISRTTDTSADTFDFPYGGMISVRIRGGYPAAGRFLEQLRLFTLAESLGGVESLAEHPAGMTHSGLPEEQRQKLGISGGLVRLSVGIEDGDDLITDVVKALERSQ
ncbi:related to CYS3-cystathionine gamma-lyase [Armillaria ostoyae]|uniref:cystathionine gamma-lyase n=1 Tax=Armillaria ostoyae TaxID=47428 RepID=A0A284QK53_ARMOS|nr:related to CYS3-cystathionine gamma-lyase [Armillaria ostoyae]